MNPLFFPSNKINNAYASFEGLTTDNAAKLIIAMNAKLQHESHEGYFIESGTYKGKSAAIYLGLENINSCILIDKFDNGAARMLSQKFEKKINFYTGESEYLIDKCFRSMPSEKCLHAHLDASHYFDNVKNEILVATSHVNTEGLICLDDWSDVFPQVRAAYYSAIYQDNIDWELLLFGFNKAFLCHKSRFDSWSQYILSHLQNNLFDLGLQETQIVRTNFSDNCRSFMIRTRKSDQPLLYGQNFLPSDIYTVNPTQT